MRSIAIVIPACAEADTLPKTLASLDHSAKASTTKGKNCTVVVVVNQSQNAESSIYKDNVETLSWLTSQKGNYGFSLVVLDQTQPGLTHGVGEARKTGMDYVASTVLSSPHDRIVSLDADTLVSENYLDQLTYQETSGAGFTLPFAHDLKDPVFGYPITLYELYLRYIQKMLEKAKSPFAFFTIGSCMGTDVHHYRVSGGMVKKDATEDFHFLNKLRKLGPIEQITKTCVYPSVRSSKRVYLGTGHFLLSFQKNHQKAWSSLMLPSPICFSELKEFLQCLEQYYETPNEVASRLKNWDWIQDDVEKERLVERLQKNLKNSTKKEAFLKRLPQIFDGIQTWRLLRTVSQKEEHPNEETFFGYCRTLVSNPKASPRELLLTFRKLDGFT